jgi:hypothetical protein
MVKMQKNVEIVQKCRKTSKNSGQKKNVQNFEKVPENSSYYRKRGENFEKK